MHPAPRSIATGKFAGSAYQTFLRQLEPARLSDKDGLLLAIFSGLRH